MLFQKIFYIINSILIYTDRIYLKWKINVFNPSYLHLQDPSVCAIERSDAWETPTCQTNVSIPFHSRYIPRLPFQSVLMFRCDRNLLQWRQVVLSERSHKALKWLLNYYYHHYFNKYFKKSKCTIYVYHKWKKYIIIEYIVHTLIYILEEGI